MTGSQLLQLLLVFGIAIYAGTHCIFSGLALIRTHDFTGWKIKDGIDPAKLTGAARYFGALLCVIGVIFYSVLLIWVLPRSQWRIICIPPILWGIALLCGLHLYARPKSNSAKRRHRPPAP